MEAAVRARDRETCLISGMRSSVCRAVCIAPAGGEAYAAVRVPAGHVTAGITLCPDLAAFFAQGDIALEPVSVPLLPAYSSQPLW